MNKAKTSRENYLKIILRIQRADGFARGKEIARQMGVTLPSVTHAIKQLKQEAYIQVDEKRKITLTTKGMAAAQQIQHRFDILYRFCLFLGLSPEDSWLKAGRMEHVVSEDTSHRLEAALALIL